ncbi:hypothetical protein BAZSYMA_ACONTIG22223_2 [Bathymodiolus azoricus thioautotrophic gill symbiont]|uniref:Uncharacterized protein n=1 Tax=Bathymodiolus azoricus thioautotrophic gill symbiont TaxID=235205 RepID=A0A1H6LKB7_9GAMM|nr:hypothetical protein BAZSYMA_ACONTIG22223_2 [Bathymodiolus azoricus thioautotrophic gill symbiont]
MVVRFINIDEIVSHHYLTKLFFHNFNREKITKVYCN